MRTHNNSMAGQWVHIKIYVSCIRETFKKIWENYILDIWVKPDRILQDLTKSLFCQLQVSFLLHLLDFQLFCQLLIRCKLFLFIQLTIRKKLRIHKREKIQNCKVNPTFPKLTFFFSSCCFFLSRFSFSFIFSASFFFSDTLASEIKKQGQSKPLGQTTPSNQVESTHFQPVHYDNKKTRQQPV